MQGPWDEARPSDSKGRPEPHFSFHLSHSSGNFFREGDGTVAGSGAGSSGWKEVQKPSAAAALSTSSPSMHPLRHSSLGSRGSSPLFAAAATTRV